MGVRVLIVDDDMDFAQLLSMRLQANGYEPAVAFDALQAIKQAQDTKPNVIILDIRLPGGSGFRVFKSLREIYHTALTPIIFVTGFDKADAGEKQKVQEGLERLGTPFLIKPFEAEKLLATIEAALKTPVDIPDKKNELEIVKEIITAMSQT